MRKTRPIALGGMLSAAAVVVMCLGTMIPVNTYICPMVCILVTQWVRLACGARIGWCCYAVVSILSLLLAADREAALVYAVMGYYPMIRTKLEKIRPKWLSYVGKVGLFTLTAVLCYSVFAAVLGLPQEEFQSVMMIAVVVLWDVCFLLVDRLLGMKFRKR